MTNTMRRMRTECMMCRTMCMCKGMMRCDTAVFQARFYPEFFVSCDGREEQAG